MPPTDQDIRRFRRWTMLIYVVGITLLFFAMIRGYLVALVMAAVLTAVAAPLHRRLTRLLGGRETLSAALTVCIMLLVVVLPLLALLGMILAQGIQVAQELTPWLQHMVQDPGATRAELVGRLGIPEEWAGYVDQGVAKVGAVSGAIGQFVLTRFSGAAAGAAGFLLQLFVALYAMFFFLLGGRKLFEDLMYFLPVAPEARDQLIERFALSAKAVIKGTFLIGLIQGALGGVALWAAGIPGAIFWAAVMAVLSVLPGVGTTLVWLPVAIYLFATGSTFTGVLYVLWNAGVVGSVDNLLRPRLVGKDIQLPDLMILLGTLGGLKIFGAAGLVVGPIVAALFVTVWQIYGVVFADYLDPRVRSGGAGA
ncbi:MAG: AI-2E family transporter [Acidobacteria bacterium]|jgi:predicted PurR-regulated permease PerM|nr:AI-2E family transporter [Acidobacteriota bacterium]